MKSKGIAYFIEMKDISNNGKSILKTTGLISRSRFSEMQPQQALLDVIEYFGYYKLSFD